MQDLKNSSLYCYIPNSSFHQKKFPILQSKRQKFLTWPKESYFLIPLPSSLGSSWTKLILAFFIPATGGSVPWGHVISLHRSFSMPSPKLIIILTFFSTKPNSVLDLNLMIISLENPSLTAVTSKSSYFLILYLKWPLFRSLYCGCICIGTDMINVLPLEWTVSFVWVGTVSDLWSYDDSLNKWMHALLPLYFFKF